MKKSIVLAVLTVLAIVALTEGRGRCGVSDFFISLMFQSLIVFDTSRDAIQDAVLAVHVQDADHAAPDHSAGAVVLFLLHLWGSDLTGQQTRLARATLSGQRTHLERQIWPIWASGQPTSVPQG